MIIWMAVTPDKYELPIAVSDTAVELGKMVGVKADYISQAFCKRLNGKKWGFKIIKVEID